MATRSTEVRAPRPAPNRPTQRRPRLAMLGARELRARTQLRRARLLAVVAAAILAGALLLVAAAQAEVASQQLRIDSVQQQLTGAMTSNGNLELQRAQLESPSRILQIAEHKLGMVAPSSVTYLVPVKAGPIVGTSPRSGKS